MTRVVRFAEQIQACVKMHWASLAYRFRDHGCNDWHIENLFEPSKFDINWLQLSETSSRDVDPSLLVLHAEPDLNHQLRFGFVVDELFYGRSRVVTNGQHILKVAGEREQEIKAGLVIAFDRLVPNVLIRDEVSALATHFGSAPFVALHIRRGDVVSNLIRSVKAPENHDRLVNDIKHFLKRCSPTGLMIQALRTDEKADKVVVFGEDKESISEAMRAIGGGAACMPANDQIGPIQRAYAEVLIMKRATSIYSAKSQFSRLAAEVGHSTLHEIAPEGDPGPWLAFLRQTILDPAGASAAHGARVSELYLQLWREEARLNETRKRRTKPAPSVQ